MDWEQIIRILAEIVHPKISPEEREDVIKRVLESKPVEALFANQREAARLCPDGWANMRQVFALDREDAERGTSENEEAAARLLSEPATLEYQRIKRELDARNPLGNPLAQLKNEGGVLASIKVDPPPVTRREYPNPFLLPGESLGEGGG